jgi:rhamnogalacturonyl hydrolase YesR
MTIDRKLRPRDLKPQLDRTFDLASRKVLAIDRTWDVSRGTPVFTVEGVYTTRGWTEWTQGFQYGCALLAFDATDDARLLKLGRKRTFEKMLPHVTHIGVHDHGFNNLSTYGNLLRLAVENRYKAGDEERRHLADLLRASGAVQASRWSGIRVDNPHPLSAKASALGYIHSFNGPHSLFVDTMRTTRILSVAWKLGHALMHENDRRAGLLRRAVQHGLATNQYVVFHGKSDHTYDVRGRTAHEAVFNRTDGCFRCRSTQQGYSPFSTWTRGLAWALLGYAEHLEFFATIDEKLFEASVGLKKRDVVRVYEQAAIDTSDHYINDVTAADGIPYWDDGAPGLARLEGWQSRPADPFNEHEPVDSSAAAIAAQGLMRLGAYLGRKGDRYTQAGLTTARTLLAEPYLSTSSKHQGLLLHSVYHRPNGWDHIPAGRKVPCGESSLWGDYHLLELAVYLNRQAHGSRYHSFFAGLE